MSGVNRFAQREEVLKKPKNRLVKAYMDIVQFFQPKALLMEQVGTVGLLARVLRLLQCSGIRAIAARVGVGSGNGVVCCGGRVS
jgi:hypothetical protein